MKTEIFCAYLTICLILFDGVKCLDRRCYTCRSRGKRGTCRDPFPFNVTQTDVVYGITVAPCSSGWCGKVVEAEDAFREGDYDIATERMCLQKPPPDYNERCATTLRNSQRVFMCFCNGDLCNAAGTHRALPITLLAPAALALYNLMRFNIPS